MHPAASIIVFTTLSGLGYGLAAALGLGLLDPALFSTKLAYGLALGLIGTGLLSSTLHLGNPQRAWRAFSQWRSSWLSREGVMALATFVPLLVSAAAAIVGDRSIPAAGLAGALMAGLTVYCTAMIYASLRSVEAWHTPLTPLCYLAFAGAGGSLLASFFAIVQGASAGLPLTLSVVFLVVAWTAKTVWLRRLGRPSGASTPETATGLGAIGRVRLFEPPHMTPNYLTREMGFRVARKHSAKLRRIAVALGGVVPGLIALSLLLSGARGSVAAAAMALALISHVAGMLVERWLFFAEARHAVMNYY